MNTEKKKLIAWLDVEASGLRPDNAKLLQVACIITDLELNRVDETGFTADIFYSEDEVDWMLRSTDQYVINMHSKTGLWDRLPQGKPLKQVEQELLAYLREYTSPEEAFLGGNSITLDRRFLEANLPRVNAWLHYRSVDVSSIAILVGAWYNGLRYEKKYTHDAVEDIQESLEELKFLRKTAFLD